MNVKLPKNGEFKGDRIQVSEFVVGHRVEDVKVRHSGKKIYIRPMINTLASTALYSSLHRELMKMHT